MTEPDDPGYLRMYSDVAQIEGVLAEARGLGEELAKLADSFGGNQQIIKDHIRIIGNSVVSRIERTEYHLRNLFPDYEQQPSIDTHEAPVVGNALGEVLRNSMDLRPCDPIPDDPNAPEIDF